MEIKIQKPVIESLINQAIPFTEKKDQTQITSHILLDANENLTIKATDREIGIKLTTNAEIKEKGKITINGKKIFEIIKTLKNKEIEIKTENDKVIISQDTSLYQLTSFNPEEFPNFPNPNDLEKLETKGEEFIDAIKKIFPSIDNNNPKFELNGALFDIKEKTNFVSTDTRRLAVYYSNAKGKEKQIIIPKRSLSEIKRIFKEDMEIFYDDTFLILKNENTLFFTKLINGSFPTYEKIIPKEFKYTINLPKQEFLSYLKQVSIISNEVKIKISKEKIEFESISDESMQAKTSFSTQTDIENFEFAVNSKYLFDFLNIINSENFTLCLNEPEIPFMLKDKNFIKIVMPISI